MATQLSTVSLVLGSGGARGFAHIGVIRWLEEKGFRIASISGSSMGALVGGVYAAGRLEEFEAWSRAIDRMDMLTLMDLSWEKSGLLKGDKVINALIKLVGDQRIEDLPIPFTAVASNIQNEKEVWLQSGSLFDAIRASVSLPFVLTPVRLNGDDLIDGGVLNPVPIAPTFGDDTDLTIAVNLGGPVKEPCQRHAPRHPKEKISPFRRKILKFIDQLQQKITDDEERDLGAYDIGNQAFDAMQSTIARLKLAAYPPDHLVTLSRNACGTFEFFRAAELIEMGYQKAQESLSCLLDS